MPLGRLGFISRVSVTRDGENNEATVAGPNRDLDKACQLALCRRTGVTKRMKVSQVFKEPDFKVPNTFAQLKVVVPERLELPTAIGSRMAIEVPAKSYGVLVFEKADPGLVAMAKGLRMGRARSPRIGRTEARRLVAKWRDGKLQQTAIDL